MSPPASPAAVPVLLLKTRSAPNDAYHELLSAPPPPPPAHLRRRRLDPCFVPVLSHRLDDAGAARLRDLLRRRRVGRRQGCAYGGLVFTSQRAVEALAAVVRDADDGTSCASSSWPPCSAPPC